MSPMSRWFGRRSAQGGRQTSDARRATVEYLADFVRTRAGVEAYVEPATKDTPVTMMLVATTGEWTRRRVPDHRAAGDLARDLGIPVYDVRFTGYPARVRAWNARQRGRN